MSAHVSLKFKKKTDSGLIPFANTVHDGIGGHAVLFTNLPFTMVVFLAAITDFTAKLGLANKGSVGQTADKVAAREVLIGLLSQLAAYVEGVAQGNAETIRAAGFEALERVHVPASPLAKPDLFNVFNLNGCRVQLHVGIQPNVYTVLVEYRTVGGTWVSAGGYTSSRAVIVTVPTPGIAYEFHVAFVGAAGTSAWSDQVTHICT